MRVDLHPEARAEFRSATLWYEERRDGLGAEFVTAIDAAFQRIGKAPKSFPRWPGTEKAPAMIRKARVERFPYVVGFEQHERRSGEIIVIDNHSDDGSVAYLQPLFPAVQFIGLDENVGFGRANNMAAGRARGEFVLFLNPDTLVEEQTFTALLDYMCAHPEVGMCGCKVFNLDGTLQLACRRSFPTPWAAFAKVFGLQAIFPRSRFLARYNQTYLDENATCYVDAISGSFMFARREALERIGGFDPAFFMYGEDLDLCYRRTRPGGRSPMCPRPRSFTTRERAPGADCLEPEIDAHQPSGSTHLD